MADPDEERDDYVYYGDALEPLEEDEVTAKKPIRIEDQEVRDEHGRRRFHGAFTGGFSAGYYNTVDTKEGWRPSEFKSSRSDRNKQQQQRPEDYMDQEDLGTFGIAPQVLRPKEEFGENHVARKKTTTVFASQGPIPGIPALHELFHPIKETIGIKLLRAMGWKPHQGAGERITKKEKIRRRKQAEALRPYTVSLPPGFKKKSDDEDESEEEEDSDKFFAPDDIPHYVVQPKTNTFGLGYSGLRGPQAPSAPSSTGRFVLFEPTLSLTDRKKKLQIAGQAFGVGAFEREDEDIYAKDDMSQYDFELGGSTAKKSSGQQLLALPSSDLLEGFVRPEKPEPLPPSYPPPDIPRNFVPIHRSGTSRFDVKPKTEAEIRGLGRHDLNAFQRAAILEEVLEEAPDQKPQPETPLAKPTPAEVVAQALAQIRRKQEEMAATAAASKAVQVKSVPPPAAPVPDSQKEAKIASLKAFVQSSITVTNFKPFARDPEKQFRFDAFTVLSKAGRLDELRLLQPEGMTEWEVEREKVEFERSVSLYQPLTGTMQNRFTSGGHVEENIEGGLVAQVDTFLQKAGGLQEDLPKIKREPYEKDPAKRAARRKQFGGLTRKRSVWKPDRLLCIRFNVPNPFPEAGSGAGQNSSKLQSKGGKFSIFDVLTAGGPSFTSAGCENVTGPVAGPAPAPTQELEWEKAEKGQLEEKSAEDLMVLPEGEAGQQPAIGGTEEAEEAEEAPYQRPPMDVFKAIFAASESEAEEEEEPEEVEAEPKVKEPVKSAVPAVKQEELDEDAYGPRLPTSSIQKIPALTATVSQGSLPEEDEWVESNRPASKKHKKDKKKTSGKKKHKKEKKSKKARKRRHSSSSSSSSPDEDSKILKKLVALKKQNKL